MRGVHSSPQKYANKTSIFYSLDTAFPFISGTYEAFSSIGGDSFCEGYNAAH